MLLLTVDLNVFRCPGQFYSSNYALPSGEKMFEMWFFMLLIKQTSESSYHQAVLL